jgi:hypothetical protein
VARRYGSRRLVVLRIGTPTRYTYAVGAALAARRFKIRAAEAAPTICADLKWPGHGNAMPLQFKVLGMWEGAAKYRRLI